VSRSRAESDLTRIGLLDVGDDRQMMREDARRSTKVARTANAKLVATGGSPAISGLNLRKMTDLEPLDAC
jgi:hypothetical protein